MLNGLKLRVRGILIKRVVDDAVVTTHFFLLQEDGWDVHAFDHCSVVLIEDAVTIQYYFVTLDRYYFTGVLVYEVFCPGAEYAGCQAAADIRRKALLINLHLIGHAEEGE